MDPRFACTTLSLAVAGCLLTGHAAAEVIFADEFTTVPDAANGYTVDGGGDFSLTAVTGAESPPNDPSNTAVRIAKTASGTKSITFTRTIDATGFQDLTLDLSAFQTATTYEQEDNLRILIQGPGDSDFGLLYRNPGPFDDDNDDSDGSVAGVRDSTAIDTISLAPSNNDSMFEIRVGVTVNANSEQYHLDRLVVSGNPIPEPGSLALGASGLLLLGGRRR